MSHTKVLVFRSALLLIAVACFPSLLNAQLTVLANGNVGIGTAAPVQKLDVVLNAANPAQESGRFTNNSTTASTKYGIRNTVSNAGTGSRYGFWNDVQQLSTSSATSYGISNTVTGGTGGSYGIYNISNAGGNGFKYGVLNQVFQNSTTGNMALGLYNYTSNTVGYTYGLYNYNYTSGASAYTNYGQFNYQYSAGTSVNYGIYNIVYTATATTPGTRYGVWTEVANTGTGIRYGIYSRSLGTPNFAGYFDGNVHVQGNFTATSDERLKTNLEPIENALEILKDLKPQKFDFRTDIPGMTFPEGRQIGIMAGNLERVLPELVKDIQTPITTDERQREQNPELGLTTDENMFKYKAVNYIGLIPVLVQAIKDQQEMLRGLRQQVEEQRVLITRLQSAVR